MKTFELVTEELDVIQNSAITIKILLNAFHEEYCEDLTSEALIYDAKYRPQIIEAKISALSILCEDILSRISQTEEKLLNTRNGAINNDKR